MGDEGKNYATREDAKRGIFNFIEMFYNPVKRHSHSGRVSPIKLEEDYFSKLGSILANPGKSNID